MVCLPLSVSVPLSFLFVQGWGTNPIPCQIPYADMVGDTVLRAHSWVAWLTGLTSPREAKGLNWRPIRLIEQVGLNRSINRKYSPTMEIDQIILHPF
jgi:hypothetical protein